NACQEIRGGKVALEMVRGLDLGGGVGSILYEDGAARAYFLFNVVGHTVALVDPSGAIVEAYSYEAFGRTRGTTNATRTNRLANTKEVDASTHLANHGYRYYDAALGRYVARDPAGYKGGMNLYAYVANNPVTKFDPLGLGFLSDVWEGIKAI